MSNANTVLEIKKNRLKLYYEAEEKVLSIPLEVRRLQGQI